MLTSGLLASFGFVALALLAYGSAKAGISFRRKADLPHFLLLAVLLIAAVGIWLELYGAPLDTVLGQYRLILALAPLALFLAYHQFGNPAFFSSSSSTVPSNDFFNYYLSPQVISELKERGYVPIGGQLREVTILVSDVRGSTKLCLDYPPDVVVRSLNLYFDVVADAVERNGGMVDKLTGDGVMAIFNAPRKLEDHTTAAYDAACEIQVRMREVNAKLAAKGLPELNVGVGLDCGEGIVGNIGSKHMVRYTVIGDVANTASRIQEFAKTGEITMTDVVRRRLDDAISPTNQRVDVRGKGMITVYKVKV